MLLSFLNINNRLVQGSASRMRTNSGMSMRSALNLKCGSKSADIIRKTFAMDVCLNDPQKLYLKQFANNIYAV